MTRSCSAKGDEKYLVKGLKRTITMLSLLKWAACRNNAMFSWPVIWWCTNSQDASFDMILMQIFWCKDSQTRQLMWVWCKDSDAQILMWWSKNAIIQVLGKRERDGTKVGEMQISRESTRRVHRCPASPSHHFRILSNSYRASELHKIASCVCGPHVTRSPSYLWQLGKNNFMCTFSIWKKSRSKTINAETTLIGSSFMTNY